MATTRFLSGAARGLQTLADPTPMLAAAMLATGIAGGLLAASVALAAPGAAPLAEPLQRPAAVLRDPARAALAGLARAGTRLVAVGERGVVLLSDDGGRQWRQAASVPVSTGLTAVQFIDGRSGWATGHGGVVLHTDDAGEHWQLQLDGRAAARLVLAEAKAGGDERAIADAERLVSEGADKPLLALHFADARRGYVAGAFGLFLETRDGGRSWQSVAGRLDNPKAAHLYALHAEGEQCWIAGEQGLLLHSADGGAHFARIATPYAGSWFAMTRDAAGAWIVAGLRGNAWRSTDAGASWHRLDGGGAAGITDALRDAAGDTWLLDQAGQLLAVDGGALRPAVATPAQQPAALLHLDDGAWLVAGWNGITRVAPTGTSTGR
ncbi:WD40/YVTN/BNR-like repeat-containing protein [Derxia gummosa]|uniref:WD40/YVTN/BNR-like repeat-containing protein n=1 Tax=Derxia gummosa DSM 723 TaxID=1121388 RepID=A0A8B6XBM8_9BURK|nr:YCF48-related protein [Derxia gummosa]